MSHDVRDRFPHTLGDVADADVETLRRSLTLELSGHIIRLARDLNGKYRPDMIRAPVADGSRGRTDLSVYTGLAGHAWTNWTVARYLIAAGKGEVAREFVDQGCAVAAAAEAHVDHRSCASHGCNFFHGYCGIYAVHAALLAARAGLVDGREREEALGGAVTRLERVVAESGHLAAEPELEVLYGLGGYLACLHTLHDWVLPTLEGTPPTATPPTLATPPTPTTCAPTTTAAHAPSHGLRKAMATAAAVALERLAGTARHPARTAPDGRWLLKWPQDSRREKHYVGGAHGLAGTLTLLMCLPPALLPPGAATQLLRQALLCVRLQDADTGNFPSSEGKSDPPRLCQWCHGAPGFIPLMAAAVRLARSQRSLPAGHAQAVAADLADRVERECAASAAEAAVCVWQRGVLTKGASMCHGTGGNAMLLLSHYRLTSEARVALQALRMVHLALTTRGGLGLGGDRPYSLMEGFGGVLCAVCAVLAPDAGIAFPGYPRLS